MKTIKIYLLLFVLLVSYDAYSQDTIGGYIKSSCLQSFLPINTLPELQLRRLGDMVSISGMIQANCAGTHLAIISRSGDSIFVTSKDTGHLANCLCYYTFELLVKVPSTTKILVFNNVVYNISALPDIKNVADTIGGYIKSSCLQSFLPINTLPELQLRRLGDMVSISGMIQANCAGTHLAIVNRSGDSVFVTSKDTGQLATCSCIYLFDLSVGVSAATKILVFNNAIYDLRALTDIVNIPDTISGYFTSRCTTFNGTFPDPQFERLGDSISITGMIGANCTGSHIAIIKRSDDSIFVSSKDTGLLATCSCVYNYKLKVKASASDTILVLNQIVYNLNSILDGIDKVEDKFELIDVYYDPTIESLRIEQKSGVMMNSVSIYDNVGCLQLSVANDRSIIDMSGYKSGLYILEFVMVDNRHITRKIMKK